MGFGLEEGVSFVLAGSGKSDQRMRWGGRRECRVRRDANRSPATVGVAVLALALLGFQLSRVYLFIPADEFICSASDHSHDPGSIAEHEHEHQTIEIPLSDAPGRSDYIQHCKGTLYGLGLSPVQPFGLPVAVSHQRLAAAYASPLARGHRVLEPHLPPPFEPPRRLS